MSEKQYVVFKLNAEEFGIDIMDVKEIIPYQGSVSVPNSPDFVEWIINYRGSIIPIISLKKRFKLELSKTTKDTRIIVINLRDKEIGFAVDEASQTLRINKDQIDPAPDIISEIDRRFITGVGKINDNRLLILLDLQKIFTEREKDQINNVGV